MGERDSRIGAIRMGQPNNLKREWLDISGKAQGATIGGALGVVIVLIIDGLAQLPSPAAAVLVGALATIFSYLLPETPPWKRNGK